jgi:hypothetical protein
MFPVAPPPRDDVDQAPIAEQVEAAPGEVELDAVVRAQSSAPQVVKRLTHWRIAYGPPWMRWQSYRKRFGKFLMPIRSSSVRSFFCVEIWSFPNIGSTKLLGSMRARNRPPVSPKSTLAVPSRSASHPVDTLDGLDTFLREFRCVSPIWELPENCVPCVQSVHPTVIL